jgi:hypothetical protein
LESFVEKILYFCEADSGGIMEYAIRQSAALAVKKNLMKLSDSAYSFNK